MRWLKQSAACLGAVLIAAVCSPTPPASAGPICVTQEDCVDTNPCTIDECMQHICVHLPSDQVGCDDGDECTTNDRCAFGNCTGDTVPGCGLPTETPTTAPIPTATSTPPVAHECEGDFDEDHHVTVDEILSMVTNALNGCPDGDDCDGDFNADGRVTVDEILTAVRHGLEGCPVPFACTMDDVCSGEATCIAPPSCEGFPRQTERTRLCDGTCSGPVRAECVCANRDGCGSQQGTCTEECQLTAGDTQSRCNARCVTREAQCATCRSDLSGLRVACQRTRELVETGTLPASALTQCLADVAAKEADCESTCSMATACPTGCQSEVQTALTMCLGSCQLAAIDCLKVGCCA